MRSFVLLAEGPAQVAARRAATLDHLRQSSAEQKSFLERAPHGANFALVNASVGTPETIDLGGIDEVARYNAHLVQQRV